MGEVLGRGRKAGAKNKKWPSCGGASRINPKSCRLFGPLTQTTITDKQSLAKRIREDARHGSSIVDEELQRSLRIIAAPVRDHLPKLACRETCKTNHATL